MQVFTSPYCLSAGGTSRQLVVNMEPLNRPQFEVTLYWPILDNLYAITLCANTSHTPFTFANAVVAKNQAKKGSVLKAEKSQAQARESIYHAPSNRIPTELINLVIMSLIIAFISAYNFNQVDWGAPGRRYSLGEFHRGFSLFGAYLIKNHP